MSSQEIEPTNENTHPNPQATGANEGTQTYGTGATGAIPPGALSRQQQRLQLQVERYHQMAQRSEER